MILRSNPPIVVLWWYLSNCGIKKQISILFPGVYSSPWFILMSINAVWAVGGIAFHTLLIPP